MLFRSVQEVQHRPQDLPRPPDERCEARFQQPCRRVEKWKPVARAGDDGRELRERVEEVEDLREEEEEERLGKVAENADDGERHAGKVAERVADERARGVPAIQRRQCELGPWGRDMRTSCGAGDRGRRR